MSVKGPILVKVSSIIKLLINYKMKADFPTSNHQASDSITFTVICKRQQQSIVIWVIQYAVYEDRLMTTAAIGNL